MALENSDTSASRYYSFYFRAERRFSNGLSLLASYSWSRSMDNVTGLNTAGNQPGCGVSGPQNAYNLKGEWSLSTHDVPSRFTTAITYDLPFGKGKQFLSGSRVLDLLVGGWSANAFGGSKRISVVGHTTEQQQRDRRELSKAQRHGLISRNFGIKDARIYGWLNPAAFTQAAQFTFGNTSRFLDVRGPGLFNWDLSIFKSFTIRERLKSQFRAEALNATNTVYFGTASTSISSSTFGLITSQINNPRMVQLGVRATFQCTSKTRAVHAGQAADPRVLRLRCGRSSRKQSISTRGLRRCSWAATAA